MGGPAIDQAVQPEQEMAARAHHHPGPDDRLGRSGEVVGERVSGQRDIAVGRVVDLDPVAGQTGLVLQGHAVRGHDLVDHDAPVDLRGERRGWRGWRGVGSAIGRSAVRPWSGIDRWGVDGTAAAAAIRVAAVGPGVAPLLHDDDAGIRRAIRRLSVDTASTDRRLATIAAAQQSRADNQNRHPASNGHRPHHNAQLSSAIPGKLCILKYILECIPVRISGGSREALDARWRESC